MWLSIVQPRMRKIQILFFFPSVDVLEQKLNINSSYFAPLVKCEKGEKHVKHVPCVGGKLASRQEEKQGPAPRWVVLRFHTCRKSQ